MSASAARAIGVTLGAVTMLSAGVLAGDWWWVAALIGAVAAVGSVADRHLAHAHVLATLVLAVGLAVESAIWFVPLLVAGTIGTIELCAAADRTTVIRPVVPDVKRAAITIPATAVLSAAVLVTAELPVAAFSGAVVVAAAAGVVATRVIAR